ncbi:MAG: corrinoid protein [Verrucomicrobiota bacterium]|mgnify:FL=1|jgi:5-methyltetrahydrofolate--homocysteine methyltransferase|nr:corrinoid protein [Verrucomicrobiota bacterium]MDP6252160.1 corrinoid protein [Verrucomicrobiota bacterium]MDP7178544.1 corrinoid protein [Verrucomicrobiota bacterium]MDP7293094.1 corrinoid protein [Verrucomicrobiota bacterium]MDP7440575.1 corrinoid protein [Verrucomicrobiota bacterium]|tara:strand:- start:347 stop:1030 length:684 start_codon:yes stop_codon:yes gene_type:complete
MPDNDSNMPDYASMNQLLFEGKAPEVQRLTAEAIANGCDVNEVLNDGLIAGMNVVGEDFKRNRVYLPEVVLAARAMKAGMTVLNPLLAAQQGEGDSMGTLVMGTVKGDLHDIGKNLVLMMAEGAGFKSVNLGTNTSAADFISAVREHDATLLGMSALLTTTMIYMKTVITEMEAAGLGHVKICVGGAPVTQLFADEIGADGYAPDAATAVDLFKNLASEMKTTSTAG